MSRRPQPKPRAVRRQERRASRAVGSGSERREHGRTRRREDGRGNRPIPPIALMAFALLLVAAIPFLAHHGYRVVQTQRLVDARTMCPGGTAAHPVSESPRDLLGLESGARCLVPVTGELDGPHQRRHEMGTHWFLRVDGEVFDDFNLPVSLRRTDGSATATALTRDGDVVAIVLADGSTVTTWDVGWRGATQELLFMLGCLGGAVAAIDFGLRRRGATGSWWRVRGPYVNPGSVWGTAILVPSSFALVAMMFGVPWWSCLVILVAGAVASAVLVVDVIPAPAWIHRRFLSLAGTRHRTFVRSRRMLASWTSRVHSSGRRRSRRRPSTGSSAGS